MIQMNRQKRERKRKLPAWTRHSRSLRTQSARVIPLCAAMLAFGGAQRVVQAADYYVATNASNGNGSFTNPWSLKTALSTPDVVRPGDTIWIRGGTYKGTPTLGGFTSTLKGAPGAPITVRAYPGERVIIDANSITSDKSFHVAGAYSTFWGFEVTNTASGRKYSTSTTTQSKKANGITVRAPHTRFINLIVHDATGSGFGFWAEGVDAEIYGCLIYNNGLSKFEHGIYSQGASPNAKRIADNIIFNNSYIGLTIHSASGVATNGYFIEGNTIFNSGTITTGSRNVDIAQGKTIGRITLQNNFTYQSKPGNTDVILDYKAPQKDVWLRNNYFGGLMMIGNASPANVVANRFVGPNSIVVFAKSALTVSPSNYTWDYNTYSSKQDPGRPFSLPVGTDLKQMSFEEWRTATRFDANSTYSSARPSTVDVFMRPNLYESGRANIIVYNWALQDSVDVNVGSVLAPGASYEVRNAQDYFAEPVLSGVYDGSTPLRLPLRGLSVARTIGNLPVPLVPTGPEFNTFVLLRTN